MTGEKARAIAATLTKLANKDVSPKALYAAACLEHPKASKKEIVRGAFRALIDNAIHDPERSDRLHEMALGQRAMMNTD